MTKSGAKKILESFRTNVLKMLENTPTDIMPIARRNMYKHKSIYILKMLKNGIKNNHNISNKNKEKGLVLINCLISDYEIATVLCLK